MEAWLGDTTLHACDHCGAPDGHTVESDMGRAPKLTCRACWDAYVEEHRKNRAEFDALIASGVDRRMANRIMCVRLGLDTDGC